MALVPVTKAHPNDLPGLAGLPETKLWFIALFKLVKAMPSIVDSEADASKRACE